MYIGGEKMKIGLISDTHDMLPLIEKAVQKLNDEKVELVLLFLFFVLIISSRGPHKCGFFCINFSV